MENKKTDELNDAILNAKEVPDTPESIDGWKLNTEQLAFMQMHHKDIELAYETDDDTFFDQVVKRPDYVKFFGTMGWDEAYDRYEVWLDNQTQA